MKMIRHRNVIHLEEAFWDKGDLFMCMEMVEGSDLLKMVPPGGMDEETAKPLFFQLCSAVSFCHSKNVRISVFEETFLLNFSHLKMVGNPRGP